MKPITIGEVCKAVRGELAWGNPAGFVNSVHTDSREVGQGGLFIPIIGARVDAHDFIPDVLAQGAACVISSESTECPEEQTGAEEETA